MPPRASLDAAGAHLRHGERVDGRPDGEERRDDGGPHERTQRLQQRPDGAHGRGAGARPAKVVLGRVRIKSLRAWKDLTSPF